MKLLKQLVKAFLVVSIVSLVLYILMLMKVISMNDRVPKLLLLCVVSGYVVYLGVSVYNLIVAMKNNTLKKAYTQNSKGLTSPWVRGLFAAAFVLYLRVGTGHSTIEGVVFPILAVILPVALWPIYRYEHTEMMGEVE